MLAKLYDLVQLRWSPVEICHYDSLGLLLVCLERLLKKVGVHVPALLLTIDEDLDPSLIGDRVDSSRECEVRAEDQVSCSHVTEFDRKMQRCRSTVQRCSVAFSNI